MPEYLAPGVYIEELPPGLRPIEGVSTSNAGFVGQTERGPTPPRLVTSWPAYERLYGDYIATSISYLPYAVHGFFANGGQRAFIARVIGDNADAAGTGALTTADAAQNLQIAAIGDGLWGNRLFIRIQAASRSTATRLMFRLTVIYYSDPLPLLNGAIVDPTTDIGALTPAQRDARRDPDATEDYDNLEPRLAENMVNGASSLVRLSWSDPLAAPALPDPTAAADPQAGGYVQLQGGDNGDAIGVGDYRGDGTDPVSARTGLAGLEAIDEVNILCVPDEAHPTAGLGPIRNDVINQCARLKDRFAVLQTPMGQGTTAAVVAGVGSDTSYAAIYYPWIHVFDTKSQGPLLVPPGGHVAGIYARTDIERGVHKAPANEVVRGIITRDVNGTGPTEFKVTKGQQDILNPRSINVIRDFRSDGRGVRVWGGRTLSSDSQWRYVNVRRLFLFLEESIDEGTQWVVFEPNDEPLWARVRRSITAFLTTVWKNGALMGATPEEAFFVKCDRTTMTEDDIQNGRLICLVGVAPVRPAEFVIFRFQQKTAGADS